MSAKLSSVTDFFLIASGSSSPICAPSNESPTNYGDDIRPPAADGNHERRWVVLDFDVIIHVMRTDARARYDFEGLGRCCAGEVRRGCRQKKKSQKSEPPSAPAVQPLTPQCSGNSAEAFTISSISFLKSSVPGGDDNGIATPTSSVIRRKPAAVFSGA